MTLAPAVAILNGANQLRSEIMMRERYPLPYIAPHNYDSFRRLSGSDLPDSYDEWLQLHTKEKRERGQVGYDVQEVQVDPSESLLTIPSSLPR